MGELRDGIKKEMNIDIKNWKLYQFAFPIPNDPKTNLADFVDENEKLCLNLVRPEEPPRNGSGFKITTDKARFLVRGKRQQFEILEIRPKKHITAKLKPNYLFFGKQSFGIVTSIIGDCLGERQLQFDVYEVNKDGYILLQTDESDNDQVFLMEDGLTPPLETVELKSTDVKLYDEKHIISPKQRRELRAKYMEVLFAGISSGNITWTKIKYLVQSVQSLNVFF